MRCRRDPNLPRPEHRSTEALRQVRKRPMNAPGADKRRRGSTAAAKEAAVRTRRSDPGRLRAGAIACSCGYSIALTMSSTTFFASPKTIMVLSM
jgi:hypothetical protein